MKQNINMEHGRLSLIPKLTHTKDATNDMKMIDNEFTPQETNEHFAFISNKPIGEENPIPSMHCNSERYMLNAVSRKELYATW